MSDLQVKAVFKPKPLETVQNTSSPKPPPPPPPPPALKISAPKVVTCKLEATPEFTLLPEKILIGIDLESSQRICMKAKLIPKPSLLSGQQGPPKQSGSVSETKTETPELTAQEPSFVTTVKGTVCEETAKTIGVSYLQEAMKEVPKEVIDCFKHKNIRHVLESLIETDWLKQTLCGAHFEAENSSGSRSRKEDYTPELYGFSRGCFESSHLMGVLLQNLVLRYGQDEHKQILESLTGYGNTAHSWLEFKDSQGRTNVIDPTWRQFHMTSQESNHSNSTPFTELPHERQIQYLNRPMIFFGLKDEHNIVRLYLNVRPQAPEDKQEKLEVKQETVTETQPRPKDGQPKDGQPKPNQDKPTGK